MCFCQKRIENEALCQFGGFFMARYVILLVVLAVAGCGDDAAKKKKEQDQAVQNEKAVNVAKEAMQEILKKHEADKAVEKAAKEMVAKEAKAELKKYFDDLKEEARRKEELIRAQEEALAKAKKEFSSKEIIKEALKPFEKQVRERLEALEKAKKEPPVVEHKKAATADSPGHALASEQARLEARQKIEKEIRALNQEWHRCHYEAKLIKNFSLSFGNQGSLTPLPMETYVYRDRVQKGVDWEKFDDEIKKKITRSSDQKIADDNEEGRRYKQRLAVKDQLQQKVERAREIERELVSRWRQLYPVAGENQIAMMANYWLARAQ